MAKAVFYRAEPGRAVSQGRGVPLPEVNPPCDIVMQPRTTAGEMLPWPWEHSAQESVKSFIFSLWPNEHVVIHCSLLFKSSKRISEYSISWDLWFTSKCIRHVKAFQKRMELSLILSYCWSELFLQFSGKRSMEVNMVWGKKVGAFLLWPYFISSATNTPTRSDERSRPVLDWDMLY